MTGKIHDCYNIRGIIPKKKKSYQNNGKQNENNYIRKEGNKKFRLKNELFAEEKEFE